VLPQANAKDIPELPQRIRDELEPIPVSTMDEVLKIALRA
jgi:ATP-dependent Lon protease